MDLDRESAHLATIRYESGFSAYFEVLAQTQLLAAEVSLAQLRRDRLVAMVDLYRVRWVEDGKPRHGADGGNVEVVAVPEREYDVAQSLLSVHERP